VEVVVVVIVEVVVEVFVNNRYRNDKNSAFDTRYIIQQLMIEKDT
jgi:hypothetical protein